MYYFDTDTGLLLKTRYSDLSTTPAVKIETRYSLWGEISGSKYPARIQHFVDGKLQFEFISETITNEESADKAEF
jgi:hypothetical protein